MRPHLIILCLLCLLPASADSQTGSPRSFVAADSLLFWDSDWNNFPQLALNVDAGLRARAVTVDKTDRKRWKDMVRHWKNDVEPTLSLTGGSYARPDAEQAYFAAETANAAGKLMLLTGDAHYMEAAERMLFNLLPALATDMGDLPQRHTAAQTLRNLGGMMYATDAEGIYANFYTNCYARMRVGDMDVSIDQITGMPHDARVKLRIGLPHGTHRLKLRLRLPEWAWRKAAAAAGQPAAPMRLAPMTVYVNGRDEELPVENGYIVIDRAWNSGDEVFFDFPFDPVPTRPADTAAGQGNRIAVVRGPLLYAPVEPTDGLRFPPGGTVSESEEIGPGGHTILTTGLRTAGGTPQGAQAGTRTVSLLPYADVRMMKHPAQPWIETAQ